MRRLTMTLVAVGLFVLLGAPAVGAQTPPPPPVTGPDGQPVSEPQYTPSPTLQPSPTATGRPGSPTPCRCIEEAQPRPKPASLSIWWLILLPIWIILLIVMYKLGKTTAGDGSSGGRRVQ